MDKLRTITLPAGLGDAAWVLMKLQATGERFHFKIPDSTPQRGKQIFDLLPQIAESCIYTPGLNYKLINKANVATKGKKWKDIKQDEFTLSANLHLEQGLRIETFLPDLPMTYALGYQTTDADKEKAAAFLAGKSKYIGIYGSAYSNARNWNMWGHEEWFKLILQMYRANKDFCFVIIGAIYDTDMADLLMEQLRQYNIPHINTIGQPLPVVIEVLKRLTYFIGFPSGLSIINETLGKDGTMFYPHHLLPMMNAWPQLDRIKNHNYKGCQKCSPEQLFDWLRDVYKLFRP